MARASIKDKGYLNRATCTYKRTYSIETTILQSLELTLFSVVSESYSEVLYYKAKPASYTSFPPPPSGTQTLFEFSTSRTCKFSSNYFTYSPYLSKLP